MPCQWHSSNGIHFPVELLLNNHMKNDYNLALQAALGTMYSYFY